MNDFDEMGIVDAINRVYYPPRDWDTINRVVNRVLMPGTIVNDFDEMGIVETRLIASLPPGVGIR